MKCPVCGAQIPPLAEDCIHCFSSWREGQKDCPAYFDSLDVKCELGFRHPRKHRVTAVEVEGGKVEITLNWHYPQNNPQLIRSDEYRRRHAGR